MGFRHDGCPSECASGLRWQFHSGTSDFRVTCPEARFSVNFARLGFHPGFGLTASLPHRSGAFQAALLMYTGRHITGALAIGLVDYCVPLDQVRANATELATEITQSAPLAIVGFSSPACRK
jgi:enoyl-CoA hydratase/carnithine racemase